jgi:hypothetical protein
MRVSISGHPIANEPAALEPSEAIFHHLSHNRSAGAIVIAND